MGTWLECAENQNYCEMERAEALLHISSRLNASSDFDTVLHIVCEEPAKLLNASAAYLHLYENSIDIPCLAATYAISVDQACQLPSLDDLFDVTGIAVANGSYLHDRLDENLQIKTLVRVKLINDHQVIGILSLIFSTNRRSFTANIRTMLTGLSDIAVTHIVKGRLWRNNRHQLEAITALYNNAQRLAHSLDMTDIARDVCRTCVEVFGSPLAWLGKAESDGTIRVIGAFPDVNYPYQLTVRWDDTPAGQGPTGQAIRREEPIYINDFHKEPRFDLWRDVALKFGVESIAAFPLISRGKAFGALMVYGRKTNFFSPEKAYYIQAYAHQAATALQNAKLFADAENHAACLQSLRDIDTSITSNLDLRVTLDIVLDQILSRLHVDAADVFLYNEETNTLSCAAEKGFHSENVKHSPVYLGQSMRSSFDCKQDAAKLCSQMLRKFPLLKQRTSRLAEEEGLAYHDVIPLVSKGKMLGLLEIYRRDVLPLNMESRNFLTMLANQAAIAIGVSRLVSGLRRSNSELRSTYEATIEGWSRVLDMRDRETEGHSERVAEITLHLARLLGMKASELKNIRRGSLLHDIGKMGIPDSILLKPGPLNDDEWKIMKKHPVYAYNMLSPIPYLRSALDIPYAHHEKWDGSGYPRGLKGEEIPLAARIFAVVDVWDALSSDRPYRKAWDKARILEYMASLSGSHFDPQIISLFLKKFQRIQQLRIN